MLIRSWGLYGKVRAVQDPSAFSQISYDCCWLKSHTIGYCIIKYTTKSSPPILSTHWNRSPGFQIQAIADGAPSFASSRTTQCPEVGQSYHDIIEDKWQWQSAPVTNRISDMISCDSGICLSSARMPGSWTLPMSWLKSRHVRYGMWPVQHGPRAKQHMKDYRGRLEWHAWHSVNVASGKEV